MYDSLPPASTQHLIYQIAALLAAPKASIKMKYMDTQMQCGSADCGIFAITFAATLANGEQSGAYQFDQRKMQKHLMQCLDEKSIRAFPVTRKRRRGNMVKVSSTISVYCSCRTPEQAGCTMVECCSCKEWFHVTCVTVPQQAIGSSTKWFCSQCI